jgi:hypothetical protein
VSYTLASGCPSIGTDSGTAVTTASTLAAYPDSRHRTNVSSPISLSARNSSDALPPIAPDTAETMTYRTPSSAKIRWYASRCRR